MKKLLLILVLTFGLIGKAQTTQIPDENFEQALLDLGIDTDGALNGQVNTADIENVTELDLTGQGISDMTGIEGFSMLETIDLSNNSIVTLDFSDNPNLSNLTISFNNTLSSLNLVNNENLISLKCTYNYNLDYLDLTNNTLLEELILGEGQEASSSNSIETLDLSNNTNLKLLSISDMYDLNYIDLKNGNNIILTNVDISSVIEEIPQGPICLEVDDMEAAENNEFPYSEWSLSQTHFSTAEECTMGIGKLNPADFVFYPNPVHSQLNIKSGFPLDKLEIYTLQGKMILQQNLPRETVSLENLPTGVYFLKVYAQGSALTQKIIKK